MMELLLLLAVLICPLVMGGTMVWMLRQMRRGAVDGDRPGEDGQT
jgi:hypothetical protein